MEDRDIINLYWARDESSIHETRKTYGKFCFTLSLNIVGNHEDAEECVNDRYLHAWNAIPPERPNYFRSWISKY